MLSSESEMSWPGGCGGAKRQRISANVWPRPRDGDVGREISLRSVLEALGDVPPRNENASETAPGS
jgi:hypothetical protein